MGVARPIVGDNGHSRGGASGGYPSEFQCGTENVLGLSETNDKRRGPCILLDGHIWSQHTYALRGRGTGFSPPSGGNYEDQR